VNPYDAPKSDLYPSHGGGHRRSQTQGLNALAGIGLILFSGYVLLMVLAFASMIDPSLDDAAWWAEYASKVFGLNGTPANGSTTILAATGVVCGVLLIVRPGGKD
jgi:hypothetical protein